MYGLPDARVIVETLKCLISVCTSGSSCDRNITGACPVSGLPLKPIGLFFLCQNLLACINAACFTASGTVQIDDEKITYTGVDGTNLTGCTRGAASTSAASHTVSSSVTQVA